MASWAVAPKFFNWLDLGDRIITFHKCNLTSLDLPFSFCTPPERDGFISQLKRTRIFEAQDLPSLRKLMARNISELLGFIKLSSFLQGSPNLRKLGIFIKCRSEREPLNLKTLGGYIKQLKESGFFLHPSIKTWDDVLLGFIFKILTKRKLTKLQLVQIPFLSQACARCVNVEELKALQIHGCYGTLDFLEGLNPRDVDICLETCNIDLSYTGVTCKVLLEFFEQLQPGLQNLGLILPIQHVPEDSLDEPTIHSNPFAFSDAFIAKHAKTLQSITFLPGLYLSECAKWWMPKPKTPLDLWTIMTKPDVNVVPDSPTPTPTPFPKITQLCVTLGVWNNSGVEYIDSSFCSYFPSLRKILLRPLTSDPTWFQHYAELGKIANDQIQCDDESACKRWLHRQHVKAYEIAQAVERINTEMSRKSRPLLEWIFFGAWMGHLMGYKVSWGIWEQHSGDARNLGAQSTPPIQYTPWVEFVPNAERVVDLKGRSFR
ncbi:hypothetical protein ABW21_db0200003 [Orbilia brochopaga]|nr:hypothetical protein ABW21_db0200003 [Drechslerella brochopaga]